MLPPPLLFFPNDLKSTEVGLLVADFGSGLTIGGVNKTLTSDDSALASFPTRTYADYPYYIVKMDSMSFDGQDLGSAFSGPAILDVGTSLWYGTSDKIATFYDKIPNSKKIPSTNYWGIPCVNPMPGGGGIDLVFAGKSFRMPYQSLV